MQRAGEPTAAALPELVASAKEARASIGMTSESFRRNVAVLKYERDGKTGYLTEFNDPGAMHSELKLIARLAKEDPRFVRTRVLGLYSERQPCGMCQEHLGVIRTKTRFDFPIHWTVPDDWPLNQRATKLRELYLGESAAPKRPRTPATGGAHEEPSSPAAEAPIPAAPHEPSPAAPSKSAAPPLEPAVGPGKPPRLRGALKTFGHAAGFALVAGLAQWLYSRLQEESLSRQLNGEQSHIGQLLDAGVKDAVDRALAQPLVTSTRESSSR
jgi:hypothetical protein